MTAWAYYNELDPHAAEWLRNLIDMKLIAPGEVDDRDIRDVHPDDLRGFAQCHFFAGIGVWSYALRRAGWPDSRPVWTGSCPCQGFSAAGQQRGFDDERHLWPDWYRLIKARKPPVIFGEQVQSALIVGKARNKASEFGPYGLYDPDRDAQIPTAWFDLVCADLEEAIYAVGVRDTPAAGSGAPHIRQRLFFVAQRLEHTEGDGRLEWGAKPSRGALSADAALAGWSTASARDWKDTPGMTVVTEDGRVRLDQLPRQVALAGWPTATSTDATRGSPETPEAKKARGANTGTAMIDAAHLAPGQRRSRRTGRQARTCNAETAAIRTRMS